MEPRLEIPPCDSRAVMALVRDLGVSFAVAQVLVRRGLGDVGEARAWLACEDAHDPGEIDGLDEAVAVILRHAVGGSAITVHGDYDVDGVSSTAILVRALRAVGADVDWYLPSRTEDGYGLSIATVDRLAGRGTRLLVTVDCGITAVEEVAHARTLGLEVVVTDHHSPRADGTLPDAPIVHPALGGYPCPDLCAAGVAYKVAGALLVAAGHDAAIADADLDLVALATIADCVPLRGENRRLVRAGLLALGRTEKLGLRALMRVGRVQPGSVDARAVGFRLAPRLNAAGRLHRADAALELLLTQDEARADEVAEELDRANADRRFTEQRILFEAEAQVAALGDRMAYVLAGDDWHPGVIGIVASRIAERHHRPAVLIALTGDEGTGSGRSIPAFDLLGGLDACAAHLLRHGGHRAAAGCTIRRDDVAAFRDAFEAHAAAVLRPEDLVAVERVDTVVAGDELGQDLAEELTRLAPHGTANPSVSLLVPAARLVDPRPMGDGKHLRFTVEAGGVRARAVAFGTTALPPEAADGRVHATFALELDDYGGAVEPRLVLRRIVVADDAPPELVGEPEPRTAAWRAAVLEGARTPTLVGAVSGSHPTGGSPADGHAAPATLHRPAGRLADLPAALGGPAGILDRRGGGVAGTIAALVHTGEPVLVACADAVARRRHLAGRLSGFAVASWESLAADPTPVGDVRHVVALDPPAHPDQAAVLTALHPDGLAVLTWGKAELRFTQDVLDRDHALRPALVAAFRSLRDGGDLQEALGDRPAHVAARLLRVLLELELAELDGDEIRLAAARRTELERSAAFRAAAVHHAEGLAWLTSSVLSRAA